MTLGEHAGILSCYDGTRTCVNGAFGPCTDGQAFEIERSAAPVSSELGLRPLAYSQAVDCTNNPCNRYCREFNEVPEAGIVPKVDESAPPMSSWLTGNVSDYAPEWQVLGNREPCQVANDCQFNTFCSDPSPGSCRHSVCSEGEPLDAGCNRCADAVCAQNPECCGPARACVHDPCEVASGAPLDRQCDTCVAAVCETHPECCDNVWDEACVGYVATECAPLGQTCECPAGSVNLGTGCALAGEGPLDWFSAHDTCNAYGAGWTLLTVLDPTENELARQALQDAGVDGAWLDGLEVAVDQWRWMTRGEMFFFSNAAGGTFAPGYSYANWGSGEPALNAVGRGVTMGPDGTWRDAPIDFEQGYLCQGPKNRLGPKQSPLWWGPECAALAPEACGVSCDEGRGIGACTAHLPSDLDAACAAFDLSLGATCESGGKPQVPVCNHGQAAAPAGLRLTHLPSDQFRRASPDMSDAGECTLSEPIPPGRCVTVSDCPGLVADRALLVNPPGAAQNASECRLDDNWTVYEPLPCGPAVCESKAVEAALVRNAGCTIELDNPLGVDATQARISVGDSVPEPSCGPNEVRWGTSCYFFATDAATWDDAQNRCRGRGAGWDLVSLNSPAENTWVRSLTDRGRDVQIGLTDAAVEGDFRWTNGSCMAYQNWASAQPDNTPPGSEQCARMTATANDAWEDKNCSDSAQPYVCEGPVIDARGGCAAGQLAGPDGNCYTFDTDVRSFDEAQGSCAGLGMGWRLAFIDNVKTNDFVTGLIGCTPTWLANPPGSSYSNWAPSEAVDLSKAPYMDALGFWHTTADATARATLCQGPATATGAPVLTQVASLADCSADDQFYVTGNTTAPDALHLCPTACDAAAALAGRLIDVEIPCTPPGQPAVLTEQSVLYGEESVIGSNACPGGAPQWDFLYYDAVTPADSRIELLVRTASTADEFPANVSTPVLVASAHALPTDTQRCESVASGCPIDLYGALGSAGQLQQLPLLELIVRMVPGSNGEAPMLRDWTVRFSCPPSQ